MTLAIRWFRTQPVPAGTLGRVDIFECVLFSVMKGFWTGLALNFAALMLGVSISAVIRPPVIRSDGSEGFALVFDFYVLVASPFIGLLGGVVSARLLRGGRAGLMNILATWVSCTAVGVGLVVIWMVRSTQDIDLHFAIAALPFLMNLTVVHGSLIGVYFWRWTIRRAAAELLEGNAAPGLQWRSLACAASGLTMMATVFWSVCFLIAI
ncbi:hypothetical protein [Tabrizicola sp. BL-A-41-H6]|uniref:hypothetical protein n=1 Tax=Tabrizicola sp. BL-A-41-H6 TaxID=3421107 RepID=UPI003D67680C